MGWGAYRGKRYPIGSGGTYRVWETFVGLGGAYRGRGRPIRSEGTYRVCAMPMGGGQCL